MRNKAHRRKNGFFRSYSRLIISALIIAIFAGSALFYYERDSGLSSQDKQAPLILPASSISSIRSIPQIYQYITEFPTISDSGPNAITVGPSGDVWFVMGGLTSLGELTPENGTVKVYQLPEQKNLTANSWGVAFDDKRNLVWFTDEISNAVWSFNVQTDEFAKHALPHPRSSPYQISIDNSDNVWFTEIDGNRLGEISATTGALNEYQVPLTSAYNALINSTGPAGLAIGKDGTIWFAEAYGNAICSYSGGKFHQYDLSSFGVNSPTGIAISPNGASLWITQHGGSFISRYDPNSHFLVTISTSVIGVTESLPYFIQVDSQGNVWFNEHYGNAIGRYNPSNNTLVEYEVPSRIPNLGNLSGVVTFTLSQHGQPWFTELYTGKIGTVNISKPVQLSMRISGMSGNTLNLNGGNSGSSSLNVTVDEHLGSSPVTLKSFVGNPNVKLGIHFSKSSGSNNFASNLTITNESSGSYSNNLCWITISAVSSQVIAGEVVQIEL